MEAAVGKAVCLIKVSLPLRKRPMAKTRAWLVLRLTPSPHHLKGACLWMDVAQEEREDWVQYGTIPVTAMRDVPPGSQNKGSGYRACKTTIKSNISGIYLSKFIFRHKAFEAHKIVLDRFVGTPNHFCLQSSTFLPPFIIEVPP